MTAETQIRLDKNGLPLLTQFSEEGFIDCVLRITKRSVVDGGYRLHLAAVHGGERLGMDVFVKSNLKGGFDENMNLVKDHVYRQGVRFFRSGPESDQLVSMLAVLYGQEPRLLRMVDEETFTGILLEQNPVNMETDTIKIKLFGNDAESDMEEDYYESFFNLDLKGGFVYWNEKDLDYREPLIRALGRE